MICLVVQSPEDVVHRYRAVLKEFRRTRSVSLSCRTLDVDRNTIALTAIIAEIVIAAEGENFGPLPVFKEDTVGNYAKTCKAFLEGNKPLGEKINKMKQDSELLPIKYKFRKWEATLLSLMLMPTFALCSGSVFVWTQFLLFLLRVVNKI